MGHAKILLPAALLAGLATAPALAARVEPVRGGANPSETAAHPRARALVRPHPAALLASPGPGYDLFFGQRRPGAPAAAAASAPAPAPAPGWTLFSAWPDASNRLPPAPPASGAEPGLLLALRAGF